MSHAVAAVRSTPVRPSPACGAAIQPMSTSRTRMTRPVPAAADEAIAPRIASGLPAQACAALGSLPVRRVRRTELVTRIKPGNSAARERGGAPGRMRPVPCTLVTPNDFADLDTLQTHLLAFGRRYEQIAAPFQWKFTREDLHKLLAKTNAAQPASL